MPPKKQPEPQIPQYKACYILPIFFQGSNSPSYQSLSRPINIKKNINLEKITEILKDKGLEQHIKDGSITNKGRQFICQNLKTVCDEYQSIVAKPPDPKKDAKKDTKKDPKKNEPPPPPPPANPPIQFQLQKNCNDFYLYLDIPNNATQLQIFLTKHPTIDIVAIIKQKIKPKSRKPNYDLLNKTKTFSQITEALKNTQIDPNTLTTKQTTNINHQQKARQMIALLQKYKQQLPSLHPNKNIIILQIPYLNNVSNPQQNQLSFLTSFFERVCKCTKQLQQYIQWKQTRKLKHMIEPIKQKITKQQLKVQENIKGKKGGKPPPEPVYETVEEIVQKKYEDYPYNIRSDLKNYKTVKKVRESTKNSLQTILPKGNKQSLYKEILNNIISSLNFSSKQPSNSQRIKAKIMKVATETKQKYQNLPINKITTSHIINNLRKIKYPKILPMSNTLKFNFPPITTEYSFIQLSQKEYKNKQQLKMQYLIDKFQKLARTSSPKIQWNFTDRHFLQKFNKQQFQSIVNQELLYDPQIFTGDLQNEKLKLMILSRTNPPGRVLYHNSIFEWKVLPDFQNWVDNFVNHEQLLKIEEFFNYSHEDVGNLGIKVKNMMPNDNTVIRDEQYFIGAKKNKVIWLSKNNAKFGLTKKYVDNDKNQINVYWHDIGEQYRLRMFKTKENTYQNKQNNEQDAKLTSNNEQVPSLLGVTIENKEKYTIFMNPHPIIFWKDHQQEKIREFCSLGQIISYRIDGSTHIYHPSGNISILRNGKWKRVINNECEEDGVMKKLSITELHQGQSLIQVREDQTIFITDSQQNKKIIFPDGTQLSDNHKQRKRQIKSPHSPFIRIYLPRNDNFNTIGHGSAFAYLGFKNLLERSYDGYMLQLIDHQISYHLYIEGYDQNGKLLTEQIALIAHKDGTLFKLNRKQAKIVYTSPTKNQLLTEQVNHQRWLQTFTTSSQHSEGIFDIDLNHGQIETKDSQTNKFLAKISSKSQAKIAVSFSTQDEDDSTDTLPNGFHVTQQNYFLPSPINKIPPRIFTINQDGSATQYINKDQIADMDMSKFATTKQYNGNTQVYQYSLQDKPQQSYINLPFSQPINIDNFGLPDALKSPHTKQSLIPFQFYDIKHRIIQQVPWNTDFCNLKKLYQNLKLQHNAKQLKRDNRKNMPSPAND